MQHDNSYLRQLFQQYGKPMLKQVLQEVLTENNIAIVPAKTINIENMISTNEAIKLLGGINRQTLYKYIDQGLPAYRNGKSYKFRVNDINEFINKNNKAK